MVSALFVGESSTLSFLVWKLSMAKWDITVVLEDDYATFVSNSDRELRFHFGNNKVSIRPQLLLSKFLEDSIKKVPNKKHFNYIFLNPKISYCIPYYSEYLQPLISKGTVLLLDTHLLGNTLLWSSLGFKHIFCIYSYIDCRKISKGTYYLNTCQEKSFDIYSNNGDNDHVLSKLQKTYNSLKIGTWAFVTAPRLNYYMFEYFSRLLSVQVLMLIFEETDAMRLADIDSQASLMMKGSYKELIELVGAIQSHNRKSFLCNLKGSSELGLSLEDLVRKELELSQVRTTIALKSKRLPPVQYIAAPKLYYDFAHHFELEAMPMISTVLDTAYTVCYKTPFMESLFTFLTRIISMRDTDDSDGGPRTPLFSFKERHKNITHELFNGIKPDDNMMNFPPFTTLPDPSVPVTHTKDKQMAYATPQHAGEADVDEFQALEYLVRGTGRLAFGDDFQESVGNPSKNVDQTIHGRPTQHGIDLVPEPIQTDHDFSYYPNGSHWEPASFSAPLSSGIKLSNGGIYFPPASANSQYQLSKRLKSPSFYRKSIPITKNSSTKQLYESHTQLMESIQFNSFLEKTTSGRYGDADTAVATLNSANNSSKGSSASKGSTPKRETSQAKHPTPIEEKDNAQSTQNPNEANKGAYDQKTKSKNQRES